MKELNNFATYVKNVSAEVNRLSTSIKAEKDRNRRNRAIDSLLYAKEKLQRDMLAFGKELDNSIEKDEFLYDLD